MSAAIDAIRAVLEASFAELELPGDKASARLEVLDRELARSFEALRDASPRAPTLFDELTSIADAFRERTRTLPDPVVRAHHDWLRIRHGHYKLVVGEDGRLRAPDLPPGALALPIALLTHLHGHIRELRYAIHRREHASRCDCAALIAAGLDREPRSPELRSLGESSDGYLIGEGFACASCGLRWLHAVMDDDSGSLFWTPLDA